MLAQIAPWLSPEHWEWQNGRRTFIAAVSGHPGESFGTILGNLGRRRFENVEAVRNRAHLILLDIGAKPKEVPLNVLQPLLEAASLQEEPDLQNAWANLLANATDRRQITRVEPSFVAMLRNLSSREVRFLESLCDGADGLWNIQLGKRDVRRIYDGKVDSFEIMMALLQREGFPEAHEGSDVVVDSRHCIRLGRLQRERAFIHSRHLGSRSSGRAGSLSHPHNNFIMSSAE